MSGECLWGDERSSQRDIFVAIHSPRNFMDSTFPFVVEDKQISELRLPHISLQISL